MKGLLQPIKNRKAISEMVSYVLLVVIAVGLSIAVYSYLKIYVPNNERPECKDDIQLIMLNYTCVYNGNNPSLSALNVNVYNKGLFKVNAVYLRLTPENKKVGTNVQLTAFNNGLLPGDTKNVDVKDKSKLASVLNSAGNYILEIQPAAQSENGEFAVCVKAVITQPVTCLSVV